MPRQKGKAKAKTDAVKKLDAAKAALKDAEAKLEKADTEANKRLVEDAKAAAKIAQAAVNEERFLTVGAGRVAICLTKLTALERVANRKLYSFTETDAADITTAINAAAKKVETAFKAALASTGGAAKAGGFTFSRTLPKP